MGKEDQLRGVDGPPAPKNKLVSPIVFVGLDKQMQTQYRTNAPRVREILEAVGKEYGISLLVIASRSRKGRIPEARHIACKILRELTTLRLKQIGQLVGLADHSSVLYSIGWTEDQLEMDSNFRNKFYKILRTITK